MGTESNTAMRLIVNAETIPENILMKRAFKSAIVVGAPE